MPDMQKFKLLVHYICAQSPDTRKLGATKLNKILWYSEREAYLRLGRAISGAKFVKRQFGPVPRAIVPTLNELVAERAIVVRETSRFGKMQREFIHLTLPDVSPFTSAEISIVNNAIIEICNFHTATSISEKSHDEAWQLAEIGEELPLFTAFLMEGEVDEDDVAWARQELQVLSIGG